jgi:hypothetical protein
MNDRAPIVAELSEIYRIVIFYGWISENFTTLSPSRRTSKDGPNGP